MIKFNELREGDVIKSKTTGAVYTARESINGGYIVLRNKQGWNSPVDGFDGEDLYYVSEAPTLRKESFHIEDADAKIAKLAGAVDSLVHARPYATGLDAEKELDAAIANVAALITDIAKNELDALDER